MYLLYLDDSGSAQNPNENYLVLGGFCVFERQIHWLDQEMEKLAFSIHPSDPRAIEFHASEIFSGRKAPWKALSKESRRETIKETLRILSRSHSSIAAFACAVHKASYPGIDPMELAFEDLCSRFDLFLTRLYKEGNNQRGLVILDKCSSEKSLQKLAFIFRSGGTRWRELKNLPEVPLFVDSKASRLLQLADHIAYAVFRRYESGDTNYFDIIAPRFDKEDNTIHGLAHKQMNDPQCMCPACLSRKTK